MIAQSIIALAFAFGAVSASPVSARQSCSGSGDALANGAQPKGCWKDLAGFGGDRTFGGFAFNDAAMTNELCADTCNKKGYAWSGTQYHDQCYCGSDAPTQPYSKCDTSCSGDSSETCGGSWALTTYHNENAAVTFNYDTDAFTNIGCLVDAPNRALVGGYQATDNNSVENCADYCKTSYPNLAYFGVTYGRECFCGSEPTTSTHSTGCHSSCPGNNQENCGGTNAINVFHFK